MTRPLEIVGDQDAAVCEDGVCAIPAPASESDADD